MIHEDLNYGIQTMAKLDKVLVCRGTDQGGAPKAFGVGLQRRWHGSEACAQESVRRPWRDLVLFCRGKDQGGSPKASGSGCSGVGTEARSVRRAPSDADSALFPLVSYLVGSDLRKRT